MFARANILHFCWLIFFVTLPLSKGLNTVAEVALAVLTLWYLPVREWPKQLKQYKHAAFLTLIFGCLLVAMFYTENQSNGWRIIRHQHRFLLMPLVVIGGASLLRQRFGQYLHVFAGATALSCLIVLILYLLPEDFTRNLANSTSLMFDYQANISRESFGLYSPFIDRIQLSSLAAIAILSCLYFISSGQKKISSWVVGAFLLFMMLLMGGRGGQLALAIALLVFVLIISIRFIMPGLKRKIGFVPAVLAITLAILILFAGIPWLGFKTISPIGARVSQTQWELRMLKTGEYKNYDYNHFTTITRLVSWQNMWQVVKQAPLSGVGTGDYHDALKAVYARDRYEVQVYSHNQYLMIWAMAGLWSLLIFLFTLGYWLFALRRQQELFYFACAFLIFYLVNMLPDSVLYTQVDSMAFFTFLSLIGVQKNNPNLVTEHEKA